MQQGLYAIIDLFPFHLQARKVRCVLYSILRSNTVLGRADKPMDDGNRLGTAFVSISLWIFSGSDDLEMGVWDRLYLQSGGPCSHCLIHGRIVSALIFPANTI